MSQVESNPVSESSSQKGGRGFLAFFFGAATLALLQSLLYPPVAHQPWAEQMVLLWVGALIWVAPLAVIVAFFGNAGPLPKLFGEAGTPLRTIRAFHIGALAVTPPIWGLMHTALGVGAVSQMVMSMGLPILLLPLVLMIPARGAGYAKTTNLLGVVGIFSGILAIFLGPVSNWINYGQYEKLTLRPMERDFVVNASEQTPDVILISVDTLRSDAVLPGKYGAKTPFLDSLRDEGTWADYALSSCNRTVPGHAGMLSGRGSMWHGLHINNMQLPETLPNISVKYQEGGYRTMGLISNALMRTMTGFERGYDDFDDAIVRDTAMVQVFLIAAERYSLLSYLLPRQKYRRLIMVGMFALHGRHTAQPEELSLGGQVTSRGLHMMEQAYENDQAYFFFLHYMDPHEPYSPPIGFHGARPGDEPLDRYLEEVAFIDSCVEKVVTRCRESGRPFVILFTSDHGEHFGEVFVGKEYWGHANTLYNENLKVPFILYGDGIPKDKKVEFVSLADVAPTLLKRSGLQTEGMKGNSVLDPNWPFVDRSTIKHYSRDEHYYSFILGDYKWVSPYDWKPTDPYGGELYRWWDDPFERTPLELDELPEEAWTTFMTDLQNAPPPPTTEYDPAEAAKQMAVLEALGYLDEVNKLKKQAEEAKD